MRTPTRTTLAAIVAVVTVVGLSPVADADRNKPMPTKAEVESAQEAVARRAGDVAVIRAELAVAQNRLQDAAAQAEAAAEAYNGARWRLQLANERATKAAEAATAASQNVEDQRAEIGALAVQSFQNGAELTELTVYLGSGGPQEVADQISVTQSVGATLQSRYQEFAAADILAKTARAEADAAKRDQQAMTAKAAVSRDHAAATAATAEAAAVAIAAERSRLIVALAKAQKISVTLAARRQTGLEELARHKAAQAAAHQAAAAAAAAATADSDSPPGGGGGGGGDVYQANPPPVSTSAAAARAIKFARAQLGERYLWAAAGPNAWDCSGLTMMAWREGGVSLPHYSAAQYAQIRHISMSDLRPGDLVFWGDSPDTIHHVAMYLGDGLIIHAPRTGRPVSIDSMYYWVLPNYFGRP